MIEWCCVGFLSARRWFVPAYHSVYGLGYGCAPVRVPDHRAVEEQVSTSYEVLWEEMEDDGISLNGVLSGSFTAAIEKVTELYMRDEVLRIQLRVAKAYKSSETPTKEDT